MFRKTFHFGTENLCRNLFPLREIKEKSQTVEKNRKLLRKFKFDLPVYVH